MIIGALIGADTCAMARSLVAGGCNAMRVDSWSGKRGGKREREREKRRKRRRSRKITQHTRASSPAERETRLPELCHGSEVAGGETLSGVGSARIRARRPDGVRSTLTPRPAEVRPQKINKQVKKTNGGVGRDRPRVGDLLKVDKSRGQLPARPTANKLLEGS